MKYWGVINGKNKQSTLPETLNMIELLSRWGANLFIWWSLSWEETIRPMSPDHLERFKKIQQKCKEHGITLWAGMKPGDKRYCKSQKDKDAFRTNALKYIDNGADGFYWISDDMHKKDPTKPFAHIHSADAEPHARLIEESQTRLGHKFKAFCGQQYKGNAFEACKEYWAPIFEVLNPDVMLTWTGPQTWNRELTSQDFLWIDRPVMLFDNFFANNSKKPERAPIYPYSGRDNTLTNSIEAAVINPGRHLPYQYCALYTAMEFYKNPTSYDPAISFRKAVMELGENYHQNFNPITSERPILNPQDAYKKSKHYLSKPDIILHKNKQSSDAEDIFFKIGKTVENDQTVNFPAKALNKHVMCLGSTGSGKTVLCKQICEHALKHNIPVIAIDSQGDLASMAKTLIPGVDIDENKLNLKNWLYFQDSVEPVIFTPESTAGIPICANPFKLNSANLKNSNPIKYAQTIALLSDMFLNSLKGLPNNQSSFFKSALAQMIKHVIKAKGLNSLDDLMSVMNDIPLELKEKIDSILEKRQLNLLKRSFQVLLDSPERYLFDFGVPLDMDLLTGKTNNPDHKTRLSIIYLNTLSNQKSREFFIHILLESLYSWMLLNPEKDQKIPRMILFIDEIGLYLPPQNQKKPICKDLLIKVFKQARKYGVSCIGASQSPGDFDYRALGQTNTTFIGRLKTPQDFKRVEQLMNGNQIKHPEKQLPTLKPGEFFLGAPDYTKEVNLIKSNISIFSNSTFSEKDIANVTTDEIRQRFIQYRADSKTKPINSIDYNQSDSDKPENSTNFIDLFNLDKLSEMIHQDEVIAQNQISNTLYPSNIPIDQYTAKKIIKKALNNGWFQKSAKKIINLQLYNYPIWKTTIGTKVQILWQKNRMVLNEILIEGLHGQFLEYKNNRLHFNDSVPPFSVANDWLNGFDFIDHPQAEIPTIGDHNTFLDRESVEIIASQAFDGPTVYKNTLFLIPFWVAEFQSSLKERVEKYCIDALTGTPFYHSKFLPRYANYV